MVEQNLVGTCDDGPFIILITLPFFFYGSLKLLLKPLWTLENSVFFGWCIALILPGFNFSQPRIPGVALSNRNANTNANTLLNPPLLVCDHENVRWFSLLTIWFLMIGLLSVAIIIVQAQPSHDVWNIVHWSTAQNI